MKTSRTKAGMLVAVASFLYVIGPSRISAEPAAQATSSAKWNLLVDRISPGDTNIDPAFQVAIYENLIEELGKSKRFNQVFRNGDRKANEASNLLILKTEVENFKAGSETRRAVTTFSGATKLRVDSQLCTKDGRVIFQSQVNGNVRFFGGNLRATHNLARHVTKRLKDATLPTPTSGAIGQPSSRDAAVQAVHTWKNHEVPGNLADGNATATRESAK